MVYDINEFGAGIDGARIATSEAVYRQAFPAYRVFIYYHEVTQDVVEVRVNNTGGSAERTPSSASITLLNPLEKYIINTFDIMKIGSERAKINNRSNQISFTHIEELQGAYAQLWDEITTLAAAGNIDGLKIYIKTAGLKVDDFITTTYEGIEIMNKETLIASILEAGGKLLQELPFEGITTYGSDSVKYDVISQKLKYQTSVKYDENVTFVKLDDEIVFDYPYQKGDCVFHPFDPVRIAFRDPFDARVWYWRFSGFVDTWTESSGTNKESTITINCTDVTKMARYTYTQINTNLLDDELLPDGTIDANKGAGILLFHKELFAEFEIHEVLETLFFGAESLESTIDEDVRRFVAGLSDEEAKAYLIQNLNAIKEDIDLQTGIFQETGSTDLNLQTAMREAIYEVRREEVLRRLPNLKDKIKVIAHPGGTQFRRKSSERGVHVYFYGDMDPYDEHIGDSIKDLKTWNEVIHHRVRKSDLDDMSIDGAGSQAFPDISEWDIDKIITTIGTNAENLYHVGGGRVFYFTSSGLRRILDTNAIDKAMGNVPSMHSEFVDDLSFIYDMAENIEYCFYATPKGDVVFEMPFYDFNIENFVEQDDLTEDNFDVSELLLEYDQIFQEAYSGVYTDKELSQMTNLAFKITAAGTNYYINDYTNQPIFNYLEHFTIEPYEQYSFTNSSSDVGICTAARSSPMLVPGNSGLNTLDRRHALIQMPNLYPLLGLRMLNANMLGFIDDYSVARLYLTLQLNRMNAEARNLSVSTIPKFGLMVNRPVKWRTRTYSANIASLNDSIIWNSSCETTINMNQIRGWTGEIDSQTGKPVMKHFGGDRPFDLFRLLKGSGT